MVELLIALQMQGHRHSSRIWGFMFCLVPGRQISQLDSTTPPLPGRDSA